MGKKTHGFSVVELIITLVIIGLLSAVAVPKFISLSQKAEVTAVKEVLGELRSSLALKVASSLAKNDDISTWAFDGTAPLNPITDLLDTPPNNFIGIKSVNVLSNETGKWWDRSFRSDDHWVMYKLINTSLVRGGWENAGVNIVNRIIVITNHEDETTGLSLSPGPYSYQWTAN